MRVKDRAPFVIAAAACLVALSACTLNPATGERQLTLISEAQERAIGKQAVPQVLATFGEYPDEEWQAYVDNLGQALAAASERPHLDWEFHVLDDPLVNAFAYPGGYIYLTRGILGHFNSEAELVSVLGHEIGHVTARHSVEQMSQQQLAQLGLGVAAAASEDFRPFAGYAAAGLQVLFLKFSRDDERQADDLGLRYMTRGGYDPNQMPNVFRTFQRMQHDGPQIPDWQSTHPDPGDRVGRIEAQIVELPAELRHGAVERESYLRRLAGMTFGTNPREGYAIDNVFYHPDMAFTMTFPEGWTVVNRRQFAGALSPEEDALVILALARDETPTDAARTFFEPENVQPGNRWRNSFYHFKATQSDGSTLRGLVGFIEHRDLVFQLMAYAGGDDFSTYGNVMRRSLASFAQLEDRRYLDVQPARIEIVRVPKAMSFEEFNRRYPSSVEADDVAILNGIDPETRLEAGRLMKRVTGGELPRR
ncbi:MAG: M48 family metalloprotease [Thermoanaerobaculales bacterium]|jgi:predicted Zn-dependent protease|nr:M48 family metalloprotease [Thermoanaerobaculales bacterium]